MLSAGGGPAGEGEVRARTLTPDDALLEYLRDHGLSRISKRLVSSGALDVVATAAPGIKDILILGKVKQLERAGDADLLVLDAPAAGHAITFLPVAPAPCSTPCASARSTPRPRTCSRCSPTTTRCQVVLVTLPEETPVNELVDTAFSLEDRVGVGLGPVVVNGLYAAAAGPRRGPAEAAAAAGTTLRRRRGRGAGATRPPSASIAWRSRPSRSAGWPTSCRSPQLRLPFVFTAEIGRPSSTQLADRLLAEIDALPEVV